ncbi:hypothetical protein DFH06DRAFT_109505 [Mycena polygramma]|nr:hypothetical protein DFH06DRAFT_109505 [Mycena polygramma]
MPTTNYTIDDVSPLIQYSGTTWQPGDLTDDDLGPNYLGGTFSLCSANGDSASFSFNGTQVWIFGAKRSNHGFYSVSVDGNTTEYDGFSKNDKYTALFDSGSLNSGLHTVELTNIQNDTDKIYLDIDSITWTTDSTAQTQSLQLDDNASQFSYQPSNAWQTDLPDAMSGFQNNSGHLTQSKDASAILTFSGSTVTLFGAVGPDLGAYAVKIDGHSIGTFNATNPNYAAQTALYHADGLGAGNHTLELMNQPDSGGSVRGLAIDFAAVAAPSASASSTSTSASASASASSSAAAGHKMSSVKEGLLIAGGIAIVCLVLSVVGLTYRHNKRRADRHKAVPGRRADVASFIEGGDSVSLKPVDSRADSETTHLLDPRSTT